MTDDRRLLFHQTPAQLRRCGARGGKACARNRRQRMHTADRGARRSTPGDRGRSHRGSGCAVPVAARCGKPSPCHLPGVSADCCPADSKPSAMTFTSTIRFAVATAQHSAGCR